ncbi:unnamed protein product [Allacma fusca]|uniref:Peptidase S1 domain-containing protein n=1 Tax=Allacma fusca TaxID=39272 RepID=A0A8J2LUI2_9HEXA|nr:unnamed protein product [Allacma fusca]
MMLKIFLLSILACSQLSTGALIRPNGRGGRIVGGDESRPNSHPSIVSIQVGTEGSHRHYCGGSIINENYIITAAHCATLSPSQYFIVAGEHDLFVRDVTEQTVKVEKITNHPDYSSSSNHNDISIFKITPPLNLTEAVQPANLAPAGFEANTGILRAVGWGDLTENGDSPDRLREVIVPYVTDALCRLEYGLINYIYASMICAGESGKDACQGDSGGPLEHVITVGDTTVTTLVGLTSFGLGCARPRFPGVYTEVSYFQDFISATIAG